MAKDKTDHLQVFSQKIGLFNIIKIDRCCEFFKTLHEINVMLEKCIDRLQHAIGNGILNLALCMQFSNEIDQVIVQLGRLTQDVELEQKLNPQNRLASLILAEIGTLKENVWSLLEALDEFCKTEFNVSIW